jgi:hypothetical protein
LALTDYDERSPDFIDPSLRAHLANPAAGDRGPEVAPDCAALDIWASEGGAA